MSGDGKTRLVAQGLGLFSLALGTAELVAPGEVARLAGARDTAKNRTMLRWVGGAREFGVGLGILSGWRTPMWLWARVAGDAYDLAGLGTALAGARSSRARRMGGVSTAAVVGVTAADVVTALRSTRSR